MEVITNAPVSVDEILRKRKLTAFDCGRILLLNTIEGTHAGVSRELPERVQLFISNVDSPDSAALLQRFSNLLFWIAQFRSVTDVHSKRLGSFFTSVNGILDVASIKESMLSFFSDYPENLTRIRAAYAARSDHWVVSGLERFTDLSADASRETLKADFQMAIESLYFISGFNKILDLVADYTNVPQLLSIRIPTEPTDEAAKQYNTLREQLQAQLPHSQLPGARERLSVLTQCFPVFPSDIELDSDRLLEAQKAIRDNLKAFQFNDGWISDILCVQNK